MYTLIFNPGSLDTYTIGFELTVEELGGYQCNTQFLSIDSYDNNRIVNITLGDDISFSSNIISGSIKITFISQQTSSFTETITMRYNDSNNNINKTISQQIKMDIPQLVDLSWYARDNIEIYETIAEIPQEHLDYLNSGLVPVDMNGMFCGCNNLLSIPKLNIDTSQCSDMSNMFNFCNSLFSLDLSYFDTSKVTDMSYMFYYCRQLFSLDLSNFNTSNVTDMSWMFYACESLFSLDLSNFNTSKVTNMNSMFSSCMSLTSLNLSNFNTSKVTNMNQMFDGCINLNTIEGIIDMRSCTIYSGMFNVCPSSLKGVKIKNPPAGFDGEGLSSDQYTIVS